MPQIMHERLSSWQLVKRIFGSIAGFRLRITALILAVTVHRFLGEFGLPALVGLIHNAMIAHKPVEDVIHLILWIVLGCGLAYKALLPLAIDWFDLAKIGYPIRMQITLEGTRAVIGGPMMPDREKIASMQQPVIVDGANTVMGLIGGIVRDIVPGITLLGIALWYLFSTVPVLGFILVSCGIVDIAAAFYFNRRLKQRYVRARGLEVHQQHLNVEIFKNIRIIILERQQEESMRDYARRWLRFIGAGVKSRLGFLFSKVARDGFHVCIEATAWIIGFQYYYNDFWKMSDDPTKLVTFGFFTGFILAWSGKVLDIYNQITTFHRSLLESLPSLELFFFVIDNPTVAPTPEQQEMLRRLKAKEIREVEVEPASD